MPRGLNGDTCSGLAKLWFVMIGAGFIAGLRGVGIREAGMACDPNPGISIAGCPTDGAVPVLCIVLVLFCEFDRGRGGVLGGVLLLTATPIHEGCVRALSVCDALRFTPISPGSSAADE